MFVSLETMKYEIIFVFGQIPFCSYKPNNWSVLMSVEVENFVSEESKICLLKSYVILHSSFQIQDRQASGTG